MCEGRIEEERARFVGTCSTSYEETSRVSSRERVFKGGRLLLRLRVLLPETKIFDDWRVDDVESSSKGATPIEEEEIVGAPEAAIAEANAEAKAGVKAAINAAKNAEAKELSMRDRIFCL